MGLNRLTNRASTSQPTAADYRSLRARRWEWARPTGETIENPQYGGR